MTHRAKKPFHDLGPMKSNFLLEKIWCYLEAFLRKKLIVQNDDDITHFDGNHFLKDVAIAK